MNEKEFKKLYDSCVKYCMKTLIQYTKSQHEAEDAFAEAISIYWIRHKQGKIKNYDNIKAYILKIALNVYRNSRKANQRIVDNAITDLEHIVVDNPELFKLETAASKEVREAFKKISEDCQKMLTAKYVYGYKYEDIAEDMGRSSGNSVKVQTFRCAQYLLKMIEANRTKSTQKK